METKLQNNIIYFFVALLGISFLGFFKTYIIHFPTFENFGFSHHFHGMVALSWIFLLISQAYLIRVKNYKLHRMTGKLSYIIMPLFLISLFYVTKFGYYRTPAAQNEVEAIANTSNGLPDIIYMAILYTLALVYRKKSSHHMRFMIFTGLTMLGPGLGRLLIVTIGIPVPVAIMCMMGLIFMIGVMWLIADVRNKKSPMPLAVFLSTIIFSIVCNIFNHSTWYQAIAGWVARSFF